MKQFGRVVEVQIGSRSIRGLRIAFAAKKSISSSSDVCEIEVYNPSPDTIRVLEDPASVTRLLAGYGTPVQVATGNTVRHSLTIARQTVDQVARWQIHDGGADVARIFVSRAWAGAVSADAVVRAVIADAGLSVGYVAVPGSVQYARGYVAYGSLRDTLDGVAGDVGAVWQIQDGRVFFYARGTAKRGVAAPHWTPTSGLIGSPRKTDDGGIELQVLLAPAFRPGDPFRVTSERVSGDFTCTDVVHAGDAGWAADFYSTITGRKR